MHVSDEDQNNTSFTLCKCFVIKGDTGNSWFIFFDNKTNFQYYSAFLDFVFLP